MSDLDRSMNRSLWVLVAHSLFKEGSHTTKNAASGWALKALQFFVMPDTTAMAALETDFVLCKAGNTKGGKYHCAVDLLFDWFGLVCFANKNKNCQLSYYLFQTSQTGGQWYSDTSPP